MTKDNYTVISDDESQILTEFEIEAADRRVVSPSEIEVDDLFESDDILSASEAKSILHDSLVGVWRLVTFTLKVTLPILSAVVGWYAGRDELRILPCTVIASPECKLLQAPAPTTLMIESRWFDPPAQRYILPKFIGDDTPVKRLVPIKTQR